MIKSSIAIALFLVVVLTIPLCSKTRVGTVNENATVHQGPGPTWPVVFSLEAGATIEFGACNTDCSWYQLTSGDWIAAVHVTEAIGSSPLPTPPVPDQD
jgi:uncharacterized protein YraI